MNIFSYIDEVYLYKVLCPSIDLKKKYDEFNSYKEFIQDHTREPIYDSSEFYNAIAPDNFFINNWEELVHHLTPNFSNKYSIEAGTKFQIISPTLISKNLLDSRFASFNDSSSQRKHFEHWGERRSFKTLKNYQLEIVFNVLKQLQPPFGRVIIQMPTGSGKTRTGVEIAAYFIKDQTKVLWLSDTEELADQAFDAFTEVWEKIGLPNSAAINTSRQKINKLSKVVSDQIIFYSSTIQSLTSDDPLKKLKSTGIDINNIGLIVFDEAHKAIAPTYENLISTILSYSNKQCRLLGLTATPGRVYELTSPEFADERSENLKLSNYFNNKIVKLKDSQLETMNFLRINGIIAELSVVEIEGIQLKVKTFSEAQLTNILTKNEYRNKIIISNIIELLKEHKRVLVFANSLEHSKLLSLILASMKVRVCHVDGDTKNRSEIISNFKCGKIQVITNYSVLTTGYDDPALDCVMITRKTNSIVLYSQMIGRVLRGPSIGGTKKAKLVTLRDNIDGLIKNDEIFSFFDGYFSN